MRKLTSYRGGLVLLAVTLLTLSGCKLEVKVPQGGRVVTADGSFVCEEGQTCAIDVVDVFFDQTFIAEPNEAAGYYFSEWRDKDGYLCAGETEPCHLSTAQAAEQPELMAFLESGEVFTLSPRFIWSPECPPPELVVSPAPVHRD